MVTLYKPREKLTVATPGDVTEMRDRLSALNADAKALRAGTKAKLEDMRKERAAITAWFKRNEAEIAVMFTHPPTAPRQTLAEAMGMAHAGTQSVSARPSFSSLTPRNDFENGFPDDE